MNDSNNGLGAWRDMLRSEAALSAKRGRWGIAFVAIGWVHLATFLACQAIADPNVKSNPGHAGLWLADALASIGLLRAIAGRGWYRDSAAAVLVVRIWGTFLILAFSLATLNGLAGWSHDWFKPPWATLSSFGFATMAWLFDLRFLIFAVQMYLTGLLMVLFPGWNYLIFGVSWSLALQVIGGVLHLSPHGIGRSRNSKGISVATPATPK